MFPPPTERQARVLWRSLTALAIAVLLGLLGLFFWGLGWVINQLTSVLLPLAIAGVIACLLDPLVDFFEKRNLSRPRAILLVFMIGILALLLMAATVVPQLIHEIGQLIDRAPAYTTRLREQLDTWLSHSPRGMLIKTFWDTH